MFPLLPRKHHSIAMVIVPDCAHLVLVVAKVHAKVVKAVVRMDAQQHVLMDVIKHVRQDAETVVRTHV